MIKATKKGKRIVSGVLALQMFSAAFGMQAFAADSSYVSPNGVKTLFPAGAIQPTGTWNLGTEAGDYIYVAGMRGIDPQTNALVADEVGRVRQAFLNMKLIAESEGATLQDATRLVVYVTDMYRYRPIVNQIQEELWGAGPYPPRTIVEVDRLNQDDIVEVEGTFYAPKSKTSNEDSNSEVIAESIDSEVIIEENSEELVTTSQSNGRGYGFDNGNGYGRDNGRGNGYGKGKGNGHNSEIDNGAGNEDEVIIEDEVVSNDPNVSPNGVKTLFPAGAIQPTGTWNLGTRAGDLISVAGMRGIDPQTNTLVAGEEARIRQAFLNMKLIAESEGASLQDATRLVVYVTDMFRYRPLINQVQQELWGAGPYPPRTIIEVDRLNQDDIVEVEGTFYAPQDNSGNPNNDPSLSPNGVKTLFPAGAIQPTGTWNLGTRAGDLISVAGMRGIDPESNTLVAGEEARIRQAFLNMKLIAESEGASLQDATRLVVYVTDMYRYRPIVNQIQQELWGAGPYPPRTIIEVDRLNQDDIVEVEGTFYAPVNNVQ